jgi:hypothetical protein
LFGSAGGGPKGGAGGGRIWLNVTNTIMIDGLMTASGDNGEMEGNSVCRDKLYQVLHFQNHHLHLQAIHLWQGI